MAIYSGALNTTSIGSGTPALDWRAGAANSPKVLESGVILGAATASIFTLGRSANTPAQSGPVNLLAEDVANPFPIGQTTGAMAWTTTPTIPTNICRRASLVGAIGTAMIWTFPRGYAIAAAGPTLVLWNGAANASPTGAWIVVDE